MFKEGLPKKFSFEKLSKLQRGWRHVDLWRKGTPRSGATTEKTLSLVNGRFQRRPSSDVCADVQKCDGNDGPSNIFVPNYIGLVGHDLHFELSTKTKRIGSQSQLFPKMGFSVKGIHTCQWMGCSVVHHQQFPSCFQGQPHILVLQSSNLAATRA